MSSAAATGTTRSTADWATTTSPVARASITDTGLTGSVRAGSVRQITLLEREIWEDRTTAVGSSAPPSQRRANLLVETTDANGTKTQLGYDAANRLLARTVDPQGLALSTTYEYDAKAQRVKVTDPNGTAICNGGAVAS